MIAPSPTITRHGDAESWSTPIGQIRIERLAPGIIRTTASGYLADEFVDPIVGYVQREIDAGFRVRQFHDWLGAMGYSSQGRLRITAFQFRIRAHVDALHVLSGSRMVRMGVSVANLALDNAIVLHARRADFEAAVAGAYRR